MKLEQAVDIFLYGFCLGKSIHGGFGHRRDGQFALMADDPPRKSRGRASEVVTWNLNPNWVKQKVEEWDVGRYFLCLIVPEPQDIVAPKMDFKDQGFRLLGTQPFFWTSPSPANGTLDPCIQRMSGQSELARFERAQRRRTFDSEWFDGDDSPVRLYCKWDGSNPVGWVKSVKTPFGGNWVSDLYVAPGYRRQGLATALMTKMLIEDHRLGVEASVLLSSHAGAGLYPRLGYQRLGTLLLMRPPS